MSRTGGLVLIAFAFGGIIVATLWSRSPNATGRDRARALVLGFDGMDPKILRGLMDAGRMPNFTRLAEQGGFVPLETSMPPQSPVAWSNFISGTHPGTHQIFDFIHRDPDPGGGPAVLPGLSMSRTEPESLPWYLRWLPDPAPWFGDYNIPLSSERVKLLRRGGEFWTHLIERGIKTTIYRVPANYPPPTLDGHTCACAISGMGTPDVMGTYGEFTHFSETVPPKGRKVGGGRFVNVAMIEHRANAVLEGPGNFLVDLEALNRNLPPHQRFDAPPPTKVEFEIVRDPQAAIVKISIDDSVLVLREGEWSEWVQFELRTGVAGEWLLRAMTLPTRLPVMARFYVKQVHPTLELFVTPMNLDPTKPLNAISTPGDFSQQLADECGLYHTTGIPEHTAILTRGALNEDEYLQHCRIILDERIRQYRYALRQFGSGFLFFYFGTTDQLAHIFWRDRDPGHPGRRPEQAEQYAAVIDECYVEMDALLGEALDALDAKDTLIVMSDHGFGSFRRGLNLNSWLRDEGYLTLREPAGAERPSILADADWDRTRAYALGINSLYLNSLGRERRGIVAAADRADLLQEIGEKLLALRDPQDGARVVATVYHVDEFYPGADRRIAPDLLVGYAENYRASWATALGGAPHETFEDNLERWSGDHCVAHHLVPGILVTNRKIAVSEPALTDLAPTILAAFGIDKPAEMIGRNVLVPSEQQPIRAE